MSTGKHQVRKKYLINLYVANNVGLSDCTFAIDNKILFENFLVIGLYDYHSALVSNVSRDDYGFFKINLNKFGDLFRILGLKIYDIKNCFF